MIHLSERYRVVNLTASDYIVSRKHRKINLLSLLFSFSLKRNSPSVHNLLLSLLQFLSVFLS